MNKNHTSTGRGALLGLALLLAAGAANAAGNTIPLGSASAWTVYAFGNAQSVSDAFRAMHNFSQSAVFQNIFTLIAVLGILAIGIGSGFNSAVAKRFVGYCVGAFMVSYVFFGVNNDGPLVVNVEVIDTVDNTWKAPVTVPAVIGIPAAIISTAGYEITRQIEASFPIPDELKMSNGAPFNLSASLIADATQARITDPNISQSMAFYVQDCFTIGVGSGRLNASTLISSTDFLADMKLEHPGVLVSTLLKPGFVGTNTVDTCPNAHTHLTNAINAMPEGAASFLKSASAWSKTPALSVINAAADKVISHATNGSSNDGGAAVKQAAVLSVFKDSYRNTAAATGNNEVLTTLAITQATESQRTSWIVGAEVFNRMMGYIFAVIQVFVYAVTPLVMLAALVPGLGFALLKNFLQIVLWLAMWQPMLAVVNFIIISMQQSELGGALGSAGTFTMASVGMTTEKAANMRAAATFVGTMVPALAWAMVKGSVDFSRVIGSAVGENYAQQAANTMTTGNFSLNQGSMDSFTSNKNSTASTSDHGNGFRNADGVTTRAANIGGQSVAINGTPANMTVSKGDTVNNNGQAGTQVTEQKGGAHSLAGTEAVSNGNNGSNGSSNSVVNSELGSRGTTLGAQGNLQVGLAKPTGPGGPGASSGPGPAASNTPIQSPNDVVTGKPPLTDAVKGSANGSATVGVQVAGQNALQKSDQRVRAANELAASNDTAQDSKTAQLNNTGGEVASKGQGYQTQRAVNQQASATGQAAVDFNQQFISGGSFADAGLVSMAGNSGQPKPKASDMDANKFAKDFDNRVATVDGKHSELKDKADDAYGKGVDAHDAIKKESEGKLAKLMAGGKGSALSGKSPTSLATDELAKTPLGALAGAMKDTASNLGTDALEALNKAKEKGSNVVDDVRDNFGKNTPESAAQAAADAKAAGQDKPVQHSAQPFRGTGGQNGSPTGKGADGNHPVSSPLAKNEPPAKGAQPGNGDRPANGDQSGQGAEPQKHASNEKPKDPVVAQGDEKRPEAGSQGQQLVAQAPVPPVIPVPLPPQQPNQPETPPQPVQPLPPTQLAQATPPADGTGKSLADNLTNTGPGNEARDMQGQVLMAERRAEQAERSNREAGVQTFAIAEADTLDQAKVENQQLQSILRV